MAYVQVPKDLTKVKIKWRSTLQNARLSASCWGQHWASFLFSYKKHTWDKQCRHRHGDFDAPGIFVCHVRKGWDAPGTDLIQYHPGKNFAAVSPQVRNRESI